MSEPDYKEFYDVMMHVVQDWENLSEEWSGSSGGNAIRTVVKTIATVSELCAPNGPIAHLAWPARKDEA